PVRLAGKQFAIPVNTAGFEGFGLGSRQFRQPAPYPAQQRPAEFFPPDVAGQHQDQAQRQQGAAAEDAEDMPAVLKQANDGGDDQHRRGGTAADSQINQYQCTDQQ